MFSIVFRSFVAVIASIIISMAIGLIAIPALGGQFDQLALSMCILCPILIAGPVSFWTQLHRRQLSVTHADLQLAHAQLAQAHAELAEAHKHLAERARRDAMTGMLNRESFFSDLEEARTQAETGTLLIIDADNFKRINDVHGHLTGDDALLAIVDAIGRALRDDDLCGRIGGEEFAVFLAGANYAESHQAAERIRSEVESVSFLTKTGIAVPLSVSIGASSHQAGTALSELMRNADRRLYQAKGNGRNRVVFEPALRQAA